MKLAEDRSTEIGTVRGPPDEIGVAGGTNHRRDGEERHANAMSWVRTRTQNLRQPGYLAGKFFKGTPLN
eukprot:scaffold8637_cov153-Skeletonema_dohrnii-CCMP3373.AAC.3